MVSAKLSRRFGLFPKNTKPGSVFNITFLIFLSCTCFISHVLGLREEQSKQQFKKQKVKSISFIIINIIHLV